eukprot:1188034-Prorocentrum_minimum.AAC.4
MDWVVSSKTATRVSGSLSSGKVDRAIVSSASLNVLPFMRTVAPVGVHNSCEPFGRLVYAPGQR